ncbi:MAG: hypothetical protein ACRCW9_01835 [Cetobacterium sp.]
MKALQSLKNKMQEDYNSIFDFEKYAIEDNLKKEIIENEAIIFRNFRTMSDAAFKVSKALYENSLKLKADGSFMEWYGGIGLSKDKVSELLRRYELYMHFGDKKEWVTSLSTRAIKLLMNKELDIKLLYDAAELQLTTTEDIKVFLDARANENKTIDIAPVKSSTNFLQKEVKCVNYKNFEKLEKNLNKMDSKQLHAAEKELEVLEKYLKELRKNISDRNKEYENKDNLKLVGVADEEVK